MSIVGLSIINQRIGSGGASLPKIYTGTVDNTNIGVSFTKPVTFTELTVPNGMVITNITTAEIATINSSSGTGTTQVSYIVTWSVAPTEGDVFSITYDGLGDYVNDESVDLAAQTISINNVLNARPELSGTQFDLVDTISGAAFDFDASTLFTGNVTAYTFNGYQPLGAIIHPISGAITGTAIFGEWANYSVKATNVYGNVDSNTDSISVVSSIIPDAPTNFSLLVESTLIPDPPLNLSPIQEIF